MLKRSTPTKKISEQKKRGLENISVFRYTLSMNFKELLESKKVTGYALSKKTGIPYTTINDLVNGKTIIQNVSLKHALLIADYLRIDVKELNNLDTLTMVDFRYFRNNLLADLKRQKLKDFVKSILSKKEIDFYYKNNAKANAFYLLALIDYISRIENEPIHTERYNNLRKEKLDNPLFVGSNIITFDSIEEAEKQLNIHVIPEFKKFNIIEEDVFNVA